MGCNLYHDPYFKNINNGVASTNLFQEKLVVFARFFNKTLRKLNKKEQKNSSF